MMRALPIRVRLSLWYFAMFATAACLLSAASWWMLSRTLDATEYHDLQERAEDVQELLAHEPVNASIDELRNAFAAIYVLKDDGKWLQVRDQDGQWLFRSNRMIAENPDLAAPQMLPSRGTLSEFHQGTRYVRALAYPITVNGKHYAVQTGLAMNKSMVLLNNFGTSLMLLTPVMILLAAVGGYWMSRRALRPVAVLAAEARKINDRNLDTRLPVPQAKDEIFHLSHTLNQMLERIDKAFASVRAFTGNASHELRTPIALLRTEIEVTLYRPREAEEYRATLLRLHEETIRMTGLVDNLLSLARADGGAQAVTMVPVDVASLFQRIEQTWKTAMQVLLIDFSVEMDSGDLVLLGDSAGILRLLSILVENASKFTPPGGSVVLSATSVEESIVIAVRDAGIGIQAADLPRIFDRFYRGNHTATFGPRGSGLGLALAKWIAESHGTQLNVESEPGRGSCFTFALPRADTFRRIRTVASDVAVNADNVSI